MAGNGNENIIIRPYEEEEMLWLLPASINLDHDHQRKKQLIMRYQKHNQSKRYYSSKSPPPPQPLHNSDIEQQRKSSSSQARNQRSRNGSKWTIGGPGTQAVFLDSGKRSSGTGVFLPRRAGTQFPPSNKPACPPVILPSRVVQVLNLNVHELGLHIKPQRQERNSKHSKAAAGGKLVSGKKENIDASSGSVGSRGGRCFSPEIFLPKEWTY